MITLLTLSIIQVFAATPSAIYIGDSHSTVNYGLFEKLFDNTKYPKLNRVKIVTAQGVCGAGIHYYLRGQLRTRCGYMMLKNGQIDYKKTGRSIKIDTLLKNPSDAVIVQLGGNHWQNPKAAIPLARKMANKILDSGKRCLWIGTATSHPKKCKNIKSDRFKVHKAISSALDSLNRRDGKTCDYIDSYNQTQLINGQLINSARDCRHYTGRGYTQWASAIRNSVENFFYP